MFAGKKWLFIMSVIVIMYVQTLFVGKRHFKF